MRLFITGGQRNRALMIRGTYFKDQHLPLGEEAENGWTTGKTIAAGLALGVFAAAAGNTTNATTVSKVASKIGTMGPPPAELVSGLESAQKIVDEGLRFITTHQDYVGWRCHGENIASL